MGQRFLLRLFDTRDTPGEVQVEEIKHKTFDDAWNEAFIAVAWNGYQRADVVEVGTDYLPDPKGWQVKNLWELG